jgi:SAM-dependent methyltransferase
MLRQCRARHARENAELVHGNAEHLPFADKTFDALFHFGGVNLFTDPAGALAEFVRVVKPGGVVAYGDEGFSPDCPDTWRRRLLTRMNPGYLRTRPTPPTGLVDVSESVVYGGFAYLVLGRRAESTEG